MCQGLLYIYRHILSNAKLLMGARAVLYYVWNFLCSRYRSLCHVQVTYSFFLFLLCHITYAHMLSHNATANAFSTWPNVARWDRGVYIFASISVMKLRIICFVRFVKDLDSTILGDCASPLWKSQIRICLRKDINLQFGK